MRLLLLAAVLAAVPVGALAQQAAPVDAGPTERAAISVYADGLSLVRERRSATFPDGPAHLSVRDLPESLEDDSVSLALDGGELPEIRLQRQQLTQERLLEVSLGQEITWLVRNPETGAEREIRGRLLSHRGGVVLDTGSRIEVAPPGRLAVDALPPDVFDGVGLTATAAPGAGDHELTVGYATGGLSWSVDYEGRLLPDESALVLSARYAVVNGTGVDYPDARLRLVAGDVSRAGGPRPAARLEGAATTMMAADAVQEAPTPAPRPAGDLHIYAVSQRVDLPADRTVRRALFEPATVPVVKTYRLEASGEVWPGRMPRQEDLHPRVELEFATAADGAIDKPLPAGRVRVLGGPAADDAAAPPVLLGEARIGHVPVGETVTLRLGRAFDITADRRVVDFREVGAPAQRGRRPPYEATHEVRLTNSRGEPVTVDVRDRFQGEWRVLEESQPHDRPDHGSANWAVAVPAKGETVLTYQVRVTP